MKTNRQELLQKLEAVAPGLAGREVIEQSSCFVFNEGHVITYNEEVACRLPCDIGVTGAVAGKKLVEILGKLVEEDIDIATQDGELLINGKRRRCGITMESEITLPIETVEEATKWRKLPEDFAEAIKVVHQCTVKEHESFFLTCVNIHPEYIEACDNYQISRYPIKTGLQNPTLVKAEAIRNIIDLGATEYSVTRGFLHFRNPNQLAFSCRRYTDEYPDIGKYINDKSGKPITLPGGLADAIEKAEVFSSDNPESNNVIITLKPNKLKIKGKGSSGWYEELKKVNYNGPPITFQIAPNILIEISRQHTECVINERWLRIDGGKWAYMTSFGDMN